MNYTEIVDMALSYADREDSEVTSRVDNFILIAEGRINRDLKVRKMSVRSQVPVVAEQELYGLPNNFAGIRDIKKQSIDGGDRKPMKYRTPEQMDLLSATSSDGMFDDVYYTIRADQLQIWPAQSDGVIEIAYYQNLPPLSSTNPENWLSAYAPDCYIFGVLVEISSFVKDATTATLWDGRFKEVLADLSTDDKDERWSGTPMQMRVT